MDSLQNLPVDAFPWSIGQLESGAPIWIEDVDRLPPEADPERESFRAEGIHSLLLVPILVESTFSGMIGLDNPDLREMDSEELTSTLGLLADTLASGFRRERNEKLLRQQAEALQERAQRQNAMLRLAERLASLESLDALFDVVADELRTILDVDRISIAEIVDEDQIRLRVIAERQGSPPQHREGPLWATAPMITHSWSSLRGSALGEALQSGRIMSTRNVDPKTYPDFRYLHDERGFRQMMLLPLRTQGGIFGSLNIGSRDPTPLDEAEYEWVCELAAILAAHAGTLVARNQLRSLNDELEQRVRERTLALDRSLQEKNVLLQEIHHRVKNNLQIVSSILSMQSRGLSDPATRAQLAQSVRRVRAIAMVHEHLHAAEQSSRVEIDTYISKLAGYLRQSIAPGAHSDMRSPPLLLPIETAIPIGLILNELITNALKYGTREPAGSSTPDAQRIRIRISVSPTKQELVFLLQDNGPGFPADPLPTERSSLGLALVGALCSQLRATLHRSNHEGARCELRVPVEEETLSMIDCEPDAERRISIAQSRHP